ncbi:hypothetical protein LMG33818_000804 [Halomonadaceae bacterium LMG 33818]
MNTGKVNIYPMQAYRQLAIYATQNSLDIHNTNGLSVPGIRYTAKTHHAEFIMKR